MPIAVIMSLMIGFASGVLYKEIRHELKKRARKNRRDRIIAAKWEVLDEITRWELAHPVLLLSSVKKGGITYKHNADKMTEQQFQNCRKIKRSGGRLLI